MPSLRQTRLETWAEQATPVSSPASPFSCYEACLIYHADGNSGQARQSLRSELSCEPKKRSDNHRFFRERRQKSHRWRESHTTSYMESDFSYPFLSLLRIRTGFLAKRSEGKTVGWGSAV
ncbi:hypothetical protein H112_05062, partial [Trichophyton rubrum D6]